MNDQNFNNGYRPPEDDRPPVDIFPSRGLDFKSAFGSGMFLAMCVLQTVTVALGAFSIRIFNGGGFSFNYNINIIGLLVMIGMWMIYAGARDMSTDVMKPGGFTIVSGCIKAMRIILWVAIGILFVCGLILAAFGAALDPAIVSEALDTIYSTVEVSPEVMERIAELVNGGFAALVIIMIGVMLILAAVVMLIMNLTYYKSCHRLARSMAEYVKGGCDELDCVRGVSTWLMVLGILCALSSLSNIASGCTAAMYIIGSVFLKKYFAES